MKIGIAGAGIMGRLLAFAFVQAGHQVSIFDHGPTKNCSMAAAGLLAPIAELEKSSLLIYQLGMEALKKHWPTLLNQLGNQAHFQMIGSLVVSHPQEKIELDHFIRRIKAHQEDQTVLHYLSTQTELLALEPELTKFNSAYFFPDEGQLDNQTLLELLQQSLCRQGVIWHNQTWVTETGPKKIKTSSAVHAFDMVFDCRGLGAKSIFTQLYAVRGELIWLEAKEVNIKRPVRFLHPRYRLYIVPRPGNIYLVGASEIEAEDHTAISVRSMLELLTATYFLHPGFAEARVIKTLTQCRPAFPHHLPKIKYADGFVAVNGLYRHGFLIAPTLMVDIMQWLKSGDLSSLHFPQLWERL